MGKREGGGENAGGLDNGECGRTVVYSHNEKKNEIKCKQ